MPDMTAKSNLQRMAVLFLVVVAIGGIFAMKYTGTSPQRLLHEQDIMITEVKLEELFSHNLPADD